MIKRLFNKSFVLSFLLTLFAVGILAENTVSLNGQWQLSFWQQGTEAVVSPEQMANVKVRTIDATVPGNVEIDLEKAGIISDPMIGSNVNDLRKYEGYQWCYKKTFASPAMKAGERCELCFGGIDCFAEIWLNGKHIGSAANMLVEHRFDITKELLKNAENELTVIIRSAIIESQKYIVGTISVGTFGPEESMFVRKAPSCYGWDILPRIVSAGLWRDVRLDIVEPTHFTDVQWMTADVNVARRTALVKVDFHLAIPFEKYDKAKAYIQLERNGKTCYETTVPVMSHIMRKDISLNDVDLWWPRGMGEPALYDASVTIFDVDGKTILARDKRKIGIRTIQLDRTEINNPPETPGRFRFIVNGEPVFVRGTNWVSLDALHSRDKDWVDKTLDMVVDLNCNMVRCWGGNVYEDHPFFDCCDKEGIMVWQDFTMGCAFYPQREQFTKSIEKEAIAVVRKLRNHPSIALWSGNNEDDASLRWSLAKYNIDPNVDAASRTTLPRVIYEFDPTRPYLPSSPYYSQATYEAGSDDKYLPENHLWGPRGYYKDSFYKNATCQFVSEIGYHGCPNRSSLEKMMPKEDVYPWTDKNHTWNNAWLTKATRRYEALGYTPDRNNLMINQVNILFGKCPSDLDDFISASQFVQAEAMKYFIEKWRGAKFDDRWGIIWWNVRDGWPIISDAVADYYCSKKLAYHFIKNVQYDGCVMMLDKENGVHPLVAVNDTRNDMSGKVTVSDIESGKKIYLGEFTVKANAKNRITSLSLDGFDKGIVLIEYEIDGEKFKNHYLYGEPPYDIDKYRSLLKKINIYKSECL